MATMDYSKNSPFSYREGNYLNYDSAKNVYNLKPKHLRKTRAALAKVKAGTGFFRMVTLGDSTVAGLYVANTATDTWPAVVRSMLASAGYPSAGTGIAPFHTQLTYGMDTRWVYTAADWNWFSLYGSSMKSQQAAAPLSPVTFTSESAGTIARVYYSSGSASFTVSIDGGAAVTVPGPNAGSNITYYEVTGLANTTHSITVTRSATATAIFIHGMEVRSNATSGVLLYNGAVSGSKIADQAKVSYSQSNFATTAEFGSDLVIVRCQTNDTGITSLDTYRTGLVNVVSAVKAYGADMVLMTACPTGGKDFVDTTPILYSVAEEYDIPLIDEQDRMGTYTESNASGYMYDTFHPNKLGCLEEGSSVYRALFT